MARRRMLPAALALLAALALPTAPAAAAECADADTEITAATLPAARAAVLCLVNHERTTRGLNALSADDRLQAAAQAHSADMVARNYFEHVFEGRSPGDRIAAAGYDWQAYGENIAAGFRTARAVMLGWMRSTGHCHNVLDPGVTQLGVGIDLAAATIPGAVGTWTQNFARQRGVPAPGSETTARDACPYGALATGDGPAPPDAAAPSAGDPAGGPLGEAPSDPAAAGEDLAAGAGRVTLRLRRHARQLRVRGALRGTPADTVAVTIRSGGRTIARGVAAVVGGRYRLRERLPRSARRVVVVVRAGGLVARRGIG